MAKLDRRRLHQKVDQARKLNHYIGLGLEKAVQEAESEGRALDGTAIELALMNRAGHNLEALASAMGAAAGKRIRGNARRVEVSVDRCLAEELPGVTGLAKAIAFIALAKKAVIALDQEVSGRFPAVSEES
jgi:hypothetical protein